LCMPTTQLQIPRRARLLLASPSGRESQLRGNSR
jgi:hypothetical protein